MTADAALKEVLDHSECCPLDVLNKWWRGEMDNGAFYVLMQRALLAAQQRQHGLADPYAFARQRSPQLQAVMLAPEQRLVNEVIDKIKEQRKGKPFAVSDKSYKELVEYARQMLESGVRYHFATPRMLAEGRGLYFRNYDGGAEFLELLDHLVDGNDGAL